MKRIGVLTSGGDAPGMNACIRAVVRTAKYFGMEIYGIRQGYAGLILDDMIPMEMRSVSDIVQRGGTMLRTARCVEMYTVEGQKQAVKTLNAHGIEGLVVIGGDGSFKGAKCLSDEYGIPTIGIPGTIDNDLEYTDYTLGFDTAVNTCLDIINKLRDTMTSHERISVVEVMGRNAGWLTASASLASDVGYGPDLIYLPECNFCEEAFLNDVKTLPEQKGGVVVVVSEGLHDEKSMPLVPSIFQTDRAIYYGDVGAHLANRVIQKLGIKARSEKPGICCRAASELKSPVDLQEAVLCGRHAVQLALEGVSGVMVTLERSEPYQIHTGHVPIEHVMLTERQMPKSFINATENGVTEAFLDWCRPLIGNRPSRFLPIQNQRF